MDCPACGSENRDDARFCKSCGIALSEQPAPAPSQEPEPVPEVEATAPEPQVEQEAGAAEPPAEPAPEAGQEAPVLEMETTEPPSAEPPDPVTGEEGAEAVTGGESAPEEESSPEIEAAEAPAGESSPESKEDGPQEAAQEPEDPDLDAPEAEDEDGDDEVAFVEAGDEPFGFWREDAEPLKALAVGTVVAERYAVVEVLEHHDSEIRYLTHDLGCCWQCGFEGNEPDDEFCAQCGAMLDRKAEVVVVEVQAGRAMPSSDEPVLARLSHVGRHLLVLGEPQPLPAEVGPITPPSIRLIVGQHSDKGQVRELDEDSLFSLVLSQTYESRTGPVLGLFAVADGMGGYEGGEVASRLAIQALADRAMRSVILPELAGEMLLEEDIIVRLRQATIAANDDVYLTRQKGGNEMGTTLTVAFIRDDYLFLSHVGDCRAYRWDAAGLEQLTTDHSVVASLIAEGRAQPEEIYTHPHRSVIYRCIGDKPLVEVDTDVFPLVPGDRLVLCCDGLWEMVRNEGIEDVMMQESDPQLACELLVRRANAAGGEDNISVIIVQVVEL